MMTTSELALKLREKLAVVPDFPKPGVQFLDICPVLADASLFRELIKHKAQRYREKKVEAILGLEARGFVFGAALAYELGVPFIPARKKGKLPGKTVSVSYEKEYGPDVFEMQDGLLGAGQRVLVVDDILATGGTAEAACQLVRKAGAEVVEVACMIEIPELHGRDKVSAPVHIAIAP